VGVPAYAWRIEPHFVRIVRRELPIAELPGSLVGRRLVQISDLHAGPVVDEDYLHDAMERVARLEPDIIAITGDFVTHYDDRAIEAAHRVLGSLPPARLATVGILGNHDYGHRFRDPGVAERLLAAIGDRRITILRDEILEVEGLQIAGLDDLIGPRFAARPALERIDLARPAIVLAHNPDTADRDVWGDYRGWILCGHTHGGQCSVPFFGPPILPVRNQRYSEGEIDLGRGRRMYINRGLGYLRRVRFGVRPEITEFTLTAATG